MVQTYDLRFPVDKLKSYFESIRHLGLWGQVSLSHRPGHSPYTDGCGKAYDFLTKTRLCSERHFTELAEGSANPIAGIIEEIRQLAFQELNLRIGRIRFMTLEPKSCLSYHYDEDPFRYHIPIVTNPNSFFIVEKVFFQMPETGRVYRLRTDGYHTAVNAHEHLPRTHLVFATVPPETQHLP